MERKIGEIFEYNGEWYQCVKGDSCRNCDFYDKFKDDICFSINDCSLSHRSDKTSIIFKKLEKVGEPYKHYEKLYQCYKLPMEIEIKLLPNNYYPIGKDNLVEIEIKQKEDMEEKKIQHYDCFFDRKPTLKEFDLEAAKVGKAVCTRDGRKARIICFDKKGDYPIVALVNDYNKEEYIKSYDKFGKKFIDGETTDDLMMLPEKKEGWIVIHKEAIYDKETAEKIARETTANVIRIQKIEWEE